VDRRPALKLFSTEQLHRVEISLRVYRLADSEKSEKRKNPAQKIVEIDQNLEKSLQNEKTGLVKPMNFKLPVKIRDSKLKLQIPAADLPFPPLLVPGWPLAPALYGYTWVPDLAFNF
jgi:hypothetical protein